MYKVYLKPGKEESLKRFHPWVFSGAIAHFDGEPEEGEVVEIYTSKKEFIAKGHFQIGSIAVRVLSFCRDEAIDAGFWKRKLSIAYDMRRSIGIAGNHEPRQVVAQIGRALFPFPPQSHRTHPSGSPSKCAMAPENTQG